MKGIQRVKRKYKEVFKAYIENVFNTNYNKNALISYITNPFYKKSINYSHTNLREVVVMAEVIKELGFNVDIINYNSTKVIKYEKYDVIIGFGEPFEASFFAPTTAKKIYYGTGAHHIFQNHAEVQRLQSLKSRKGKLLKPRRLIKHSRTCSSTLADSIICLGNKFTVDSYRPYFKGEIFNIPASAYVLNSIDKFERNWDQAKYNYLWFGSSGLVHKGLDLCIDVFSKKKECNLHICGPLESDFFALYENEINNLENIHYHGFVDISSTKYKILTEKCGFAIFPSCSEGGGVSLLTAMGTGLIPLATYESSVNLCDFGFMIREVDINNISNIIDNASSLDNEELIRRSLSSYNSIVSNHSIDKYREKLKATLIQLTV